MDLAHIQLLRDNPDYEIAAIITTRNATFTLIDMDGEKSAAAQWKILKWDDANELVYIVKNTLTRPDMAYVPIQVAAYGAIDEMMVIAKK